MCICHYRRTLLAAFAALFFLVSPARAAEPATKGAPPKKPLVAVFDLWGEMSEQPADDSLPLLGSPGPSLRDVVLRMKKAADDPEVKAVVVLADGAMFGFGQAEELRAAMAKVRDAGKEVYSHSDILMTGHYLVLCGASRLSVSPTGDLWLTGLRAEQPYLRGLLSKLGIQGDFLHCGAYKSAAEMFMRDGPSPEADEMTNWLLDSIYATSVRLIAEGRKVDPKQVQAWIDGGPYTAEKAKPAGLIDAVETRDGLESLLREKYGKDVVFEKRYAKPKPPTLDLNNPFSMIGVFAEMMNGARKAKESKKPAIAVVYVDGMILPGRSDPSPFGGRSAAMSTDVSRALDEAAKDDRVKAVVLRVDSPGGSAVASEIILRATQRVKDRKPLVVSMGNVAGSGGYYVACAADTIFADDATITGSIGVVGGKFVTTAMWNKVGITWKSYQRGANAGLLSSDASFSDAERQRMQAWMDEIYGVFKGHVTAVRGGKLKKPIDEIAGGRVYTGKQALDLGLVDRLGTLADALAFAADAAKVKDYDVRTVPEPKNILEQLMDQAGGGSDDPSNLTAGRPAGWPRAAEADSLMKLAAPYLAELDPLRVRVVLAALRQLELMQREGAVMVMPESFGR
jgi:protease-4